jgi:predicted acetyltransferase
VPIEIRPLDADDLGQLLLADQRGFAHRGAPDDASPAWTTAELDRTRIAYEGRQIVGISRAYSFELTLPGGALLPAAAVSWVSVLPTHRRRGVLTQMIAALHDDAREREEPVGILTASEATIYGRFGYGVATWRLGLSAERARITFRPGVSDDEGSCRFVTRDETDDVLVPIYEACRRARAGMVSRPAFWWQPILWDQIGGGGRKAFFVVAHADAQGQDDGFVAYEVVHDWTGGVSSHTLLIHDFQAVSDRARVGLWRYCFGVDLMSKVHAVSVPVDDPLRHVVVDSRRVRTEACNDGLWVAPLDPIAFLDARSYAGPGHVVIEVHAPEGGVTTISVDAEETGAQAKATDAPADLACDSTVLAMCALGGNRWSELAGASRVDVRRPEALATADALFATSPAPALLSDF